MIVRRTAQLEFTPPLNNGVRGVAIGNFDGFHIGHQALFAELERGLKQFGSGVDVYKSLLSFYPHPRVALAKIRNQPAAEPLQLTDLRIKRLLLTERKFAELLLLHFTARLAELGAEQFVQKILVEQLSTKLVVVGEDWRFGRGREADVQRLRELGVKHGFELRVVQAVQLDGRRVSSSWVKEAISQGNLPLVKQLLARNFTLAQHVSRGAQRGRQLGFPTANQRFRGQILPKYGIYATIARLRGKEYPAVTNVGLRPTIPGAAEGGALVETYLLEPPPVELYGELLEVEFVRWIRDEQKFASLELLKKQIAHDVQRAGEILRS